MPVFVLMDRWSSRSSSLDFYKVFLLNSQNQLLSSFKHIIHFQTHKFVNTLPQNTSLSDQPNQSTCLQAFRSAADLSAPSRDSAAHSAPFNAQVAPSVLSNAPVALSAQSNVQVDPSAQSSAARHLTPASLRYF